MKTRLAVRTLFFIYSVIALPKASLAQTNVGCLGATGPYAQLYRNGYGSMVSRTDPGSVTQRANLGLPTIANSQVTIVADTTVCRIASAAYDSELGVSAPLEAPLVLKLDTQYIVVKRLKFVHMRVNILFNQDFSVMQKRIWY